jgi:hypothetical protein
MKPKEQSDRGGFVRLRHIRIAGRYGTPRLSLFPRFAAVVLVLLLCSGLKLTAQSTPIYPPWWANQGLLSGTSPNDYAAANQGQVKNMAVGAVNELNADLAQFGGAGDALNELAVSLTGTTGQTSDYAAVNLGQLKTLAQPFYDRLLSVGYTLGPLISGTYPWATGGLTSNDYAVANIGQVKNLFSFDLTYSTDSSGVPAWWEDTFFPGETFNPTGISSSDGLTNIENYLDGINPKVQLEVTVIVQ